MFLPSIAERQTLRQYRVTITHSHNSQSNPRFENASCDILQNWRNAAEWEDGGSDASEDTPTRFAFAPLSIC